jgi:hypothetical protein
MLALFAIVAVLYLTPQLRIRAVSASNIGQEEPILEPGFLVCLVSQANAGTVI